MFLKTICPHCNESTFSNVVVTMTQTPTGWMLAELDVADTLPEEDLLMMISDFVSKNKKCDIKKYGLKKMLTNGFNISPLFTDDLIAKFNSMKNNH